MASNRSIIGTSASKSSAADSGALGAAATLAKPEADGLAGCIRSSNSSDALSKSSSMPRLSPRLSSIGASSILSLALICSRLDEVLIGDSPKPPFSLKPSRSLLAGASSGASRLGSGWLTSRASLSLQLRKLP